MVETGSPRVLDILSNASATLAEGEVLQLTAAQDLRTDAAIYLNRPGLLTQVFDGLQNPLPKLAEQCGFFLQRGTYLPALPRARDLDLPFLASAFKLSGGNIRNICVAAAFYAIAEERTVTMLDLVRGTEREYQKLGRMMHAEEFGDWLGLLERTDA